MKKTEILKKFLINKKQHDKIENFLTKLKENNAHTNLVGKSTLLDPWNSHVLDSLQIQNFINNKNLSILDMGTGAGFPGIILSLFGYKHLTLVDSNGKKINFLNMIKDEMKLDLNIIKKRLENLEDLKFDIITSRALSNLSQLLSYSQKFIKKNTVLIFLKGKTVNEEIIDAQKKWKFEFSTHKSISDERGSLLIIRNFRKYK